jgi:hypothetical protein
VNRNLRHKIKVGTDEEKNMYILLVARNDSSTSYLLMPCQWHVWVEGSGAATLSAKFKGQQNKYFK